MFELFEKSVSVWGFNTFLKFERFWHFYVHRLSHNSSPPQIDGGVKESVWNFSCVLKLRLRPSTRSKQIFLSFISFSIWIQIIVSFFLEINFLYKRITSKLLSRRYSWLVLDSSIWLKALAILEFLLKFLNRVLWFFFFSIHDEFIT